MSPTRRTLLRLLLAAVALILLGLALRSVSLADVWFALRRLTATKLAILAVVNGVILVMLPARWWIFLYAQGYTLPYWQLVRYRVTAFGISYITPGPHFGGEPYQVYAVSTWHDVPYSVSIAAVTLDKLLEMLVNFAFLAGGAVLILRGQPLAGSVESQLLVTALVLLFLPLGLLVALRLGKHPISRPLVAVRSWVAASNSAAEPRWIRLVRQSEDQAIFVCRGHPSLLALAVVVSGINWLVMIGEFWLMTAMLDLGMEPLGALTALIAARIAILLPLPAALGTLEASQVLAATALGLPSAAGIAISLMIRGRDILIAVLGLGLGGMDVWRGLLHPSPAIALPDDRTAQPDQNDAIRSPLLN